VTRLAWLDGRFLPFDEARVPVTDRGFLFADGVYEVTAVLDGRLVDGPAHLARLARSADALGIPLPMAPDAIETVERKLVRRNGLREGTVYLQLTRGAAERDFLPADDLPPTLLLFTQEKAILDSPAASAGIAVATVPDLRWARRDIKSVMLLAQVIAKREARARGADDAWMVDADGFVTEAASATALIVTGGGLVTRPNGYDILPGCTRAALERLAAQDGVVLEERPFTVAEAQDAAEAMITSASTFVLPVVRIDGVAIGGGTPGPVARALRARYVEAARAGL
jgi:D-alanine transaminase